MNRKGFAILGMMAIIAVASFFGYAVHTAYIYYKTPTDNVCMERGK